MPHRRSIGRDLEALIELRATAEAEHRKWLDSKAEQKRRERARGPVK